MIQSQVSRGFLMMKQWGMPLVLVFSLAGCDTLFGPEGYFRDKEDDYLRAEPLPPIQLPEGVRSDSIGQLFVIPPIDDPNAPMPPEFTVPRPNLGDGKPEQRNEVKIQKLGERRWIAVNAPPSKVWPRTREFLASRGLALSVMDPSIGVLETDWLSIKDDPTNKDRYRIRLEQGLRSDTTEVHVLQMTVSQAVPGTGQVNWPERSINPQREGWMVDELSNYLAQQETEQASMLAQAIGMSQQKVDLVSVENVEPYLILHLDFARAWASVSGALGRKGFQSEGVNREEGQIAVYFSPAAAGDKPAEEPGMLSRLFSGGAAATNTPEDAQHYRVFLRRDENDESVQVYIRNPEGKLLDHQQADRLLRLIRANLV